MGMWPWLDGPFDADDGGVDTQALGDADDDGVVHVYGVVGRPVALRAGGRANGAVADGQNAVVYDILKQVRLLEMGMQLHLVGGGV